MRKEKIASSTHFRWAAVFCLVAVGFISLGVFYYRYEAQRIRDDKYEELSAIAKVKSDSLQDWRRHRLADVRRVSLGPLVRREIAHLLQDPMNPSARAELQIQLNINRKESVYEDALFLDTRGNILLSDNPNPAPVDQATIKAIEVALKDRKEVLSDFFRAPKGSIYIDALAPIFDNSGQPIAIVVLRSNAADFLYPFIQSWPTPSRTAETLLVCRDGDSILFLNELRHRSKIALTLKSPLTDTHLPSVQASLGNHGRLLGRDYRGIDVLAVSQPVPQSPWFIIAKVDAEEILAEVRYRAGVVGIIVFLMILISAGLIISVYRKRQEVERKRAEEVVRESESRYRELFNNISSGVAIYEAREDGADFVFKDFNRAGERIDGDKRENLIGKSIFEVRPSIKEFGLLGVFKRVWETGIPEHCPVTLYRDARLSQWYENFVYKLPSGEIVAVFDNVTERKQAEEELGRYHQHLEGLVNERTEDLMQAQDALTTLVEDLNKKTNELVLANERLKELDRLKSMFIASMSHELRTPLNSIIGFTGILLQGMAGELNDEQQDQLGRVQASGKHLLELINDVIDISKIEAGKLQASVSEFSLATVVDEAVAAHKAEIARNGLDLEIALPDDLTLNTDRRRVLQCVLNLLSNAVKYTEKGAVRLSARETRDEGTSVVLASDASDHPSSIEISVADTGIGIREEDLPVLFAPFARLESPLKVKNPGTGLGLYLTKKIAVELLGGSVVAQSKPGVGSTFTLIIPKNLSRGEIK